MISSDVIRGYTDTIILSLLRNKPGYGYEISRQISEITEKKYVMRETTLYSAFNRLEQNGYLRSFYGTESNGKRRTYYEITPTGQAYLEEKKAEWELTKEIIEKIIR
jgi:PadR family transcriptional regulator PadR